MSDNKKTIIIIIIIVILLAIVGIIIYNNAQKASRKVPLTLATVWNAKIAGTGPNGDILDFNDESNPEYVRLARQGFEKGIQDAKRELDMQEVLIGDSFDSQAYTRKINEVFADDEILMTVGTSLDETTMYTSMSMNFFKIPMLIPFADGNLSSDNSGTEYSIRMTASSAKYADYFDNLFSSALKDYLDSFVFGGKVLPIKGTNVIVFFKDNFSGNDTAVNITQKIMDNGYNVEGYVSYSGNLLYAVKTAWTNYPDEFKNASAVILIDEDNAPVEDSVKGAWKTWKDQGLSPYFFLVGYEPLEIDDELAAADNVFFIQQYVDVASCPDGIESRAEAKGYAAGQISAKALLKAAKTQPAESFGISHWLQTEEQRKESHEEYLDSYRSNIRNALMDMDEVIPCYGKVDFNLDADYRVALELVRYTGKNRYEPVDQAIFVEKVIDENRSFYGLNN